MDMTKELKALASDCEVRGWLTARTWILELLERAKSVDVDTSDADVDRVLKLLYGAQQSVRGWASTPTMNRLNAALATAIEYVTAHKGHACNVSAKTVEQCKSALSVISSGRLRWLADWFDRYDRERSNDGDDVQRDLRKLADAIDKALEGVGDVDVSSKCERPHSKLLEILNKNPDATVRRYIDGGFDCRWDRRENRLVHAAGEHSGQSAGMTIDGFFLDDWEEVKPPPPTCACCGQKLDGK